MIPVARHTTQIQMLLLAYVDKDIVVSRSDLQSFTSKWGITINFLEQHYPEFAERFEKLGNLEQELEILDEKTRQFLCLALAIRGRSEPCVKKHFLEALETGATYREVAAVFALTMKENAGNDNCWFHDILARLSKEKERELSACGCVG